MGIPHSTRTPDHVARRGRFVSYQLAPPQQGSSVTVTPIADAYVDSANPTTNYGNSTRFAKQIVRTDASPDLHSCLRF